MNNNINNHTISDFTEQSAPQSAKDTSATGSELSEGTIEQMRQQVMQQRVKVEEERYAGEVLRTGRFSIRFLVDLIGSFNWIDLS